MNLLNFRPKLIDSIRNYNKDMFMADLMSGLIVGIVALPLAIAFGIASGVTPEKGIITAIIAGFIISFLGGSKVQIGGPTGAFIVIVYGIIEKYGETGLIISTIMAGVMLVLLGVFKLGTVIKFIPYPIIVGFTSGIAVTIFTTQVADLLGLQIVGEKIPSDFVGKWSVYINNITTLDIATALVGIVSVMIIFLSPRLTKKIPGSLIAIIVVTVAVYVAKTYFGIDSIETIGDRFSINSDLPKSDIPPMSWNVIQGLLPAAVTIALLGAIESLLSATVADGAIGDNHDSNTELIAQGAANIITPIFGGIPATGAIARTMTNINNGGKTPVAGMVHAVVLLLIFLFLMPLASYIPMACLAGVLVVVSYNMSEWRIFKALLKSPKHDVAVLLITFLLTVLFDLTIAIEIGLLIACVLFIKRVMETTEISIITDQLDINKDIEGKSSSENINIPEGVEVYEINGPYFFGVATKFEETMGRVGKSPKVRIIRMRKIPFIDSTGIHNLEMLCDMCEKSGIKIILSGVHDKVEYEMIHSKVYEIVGKDYVCHNINEAIATAEKYIETH